MGEEVCKAASLKDFEQVKKCLESGSNIEEKDRNGRTPLLNAVSGGDVNTELVEFLIESGANLNAQCNVGFTALHYCAQDRLPEIANLLISKKANVNLKDQWGNTALFRALGGEPENDILVELLIKSGVDPCSKNNYGISAMSHILKIKTHSNREHFIKYNEKNS